MTQPCQTHFPEAIASDKWGGTHLSLALQLQQVGHLLLQQVAHLLLDVKLQVG